MLSVPCPLCTSTSTVPAFQAPEYVLCRRSYAHARCNGCGHLFVNPMPDTRELTDFYAQTWPRLRESFAATEVTPESLLANPVEREKIGLLRQLGLLQRPGAVLDIGFGEGGFLVSMAHAGWECVGVEFTDRVELPYDPGGWFEPRFGPDALRRLESCRYDIITLWHVLEHLPDPVDVLRFARRALRPEGTLVVAVPNAGGLSARVFGRYWFGIIPPWHLQQYRPRTLGLALCEAGFVLEETRGLGTLARRLLWSSSVTRLIEALPASWYNVLLTALLRVLRRGTALAWPALLRAEDALGLPGAIVAFARRNPLLDLTEKEPAASSALQ